MRAGAAPARAPGVAGGVTGVLSIAGLDLKRVRKGRGRIHLTPAIPADGPVHTLCAQEFALGSYDVVAEEADCTICLRRRRNPAAVSTAFFQEDVGSQLLQLSLEQAKARRRERRPEPEAEPRPRLRVVKALPKPARQPKAERPKRPPTGELDSTGMREFTPSVWLTPGGVIVRLAGERIAEVVAEGKLQVIREDDGARMRIGDLVLEQSASGWSARLAETRQ